MYDLTSIIEKFQVSLSLGPVYIFIDGLSELDNTSTTFNINQWLPNKLDVNCKFVFTLYKHCESYIELSKRKYTQIREFNALANETDYKLI